ncbi:S-layer homology domain-containing protein [Paenibacillus agaridevorans]|uniref:S-layer homology domain-containing protein n=1 Tax=Paenibacillus agaridevorans TaxID=171404 RepID=UPI001BE3EECB|nr:S-layer homology domain-containing protein [Paenibacillus agaridevorans]
MGLIKRFIVIYTVVLVCCASASEALKAKAADLPVAVEFSLEAVHSESEDEIIVSVFAQDVADVYAYEIGMGYDRRKLELVDTISGFPGISAGPIHSNDRMRFAHTQIGKTSGQSGDLKLVAFVFKKLHKGSSTIRLHTVSLVASDLTTTEYKLRHSVQAEDTTANIQLTDIRGHWAEQSIVRGVGLGIVEGYADDTFRPQRAVTRGEFVTMLSRALRLDLPVAPERPYADDGLFPSWASPHIYAAAERGYIVAYEDDTFRADRLITRMEMTAIIARAFDGMSEAGAVSYIDADDIPAWGYEAAAKATAAGLVQGKPGQRFAPNEHATRAEVVVVILHLLDAIGQVKSE